jgi:type I restriction-modification system DNA methylase subunit
MPKKVARQIKELLDREAPEERLTELFCEVLNWGRPDRLPQEIQVGQPVDDTFQIHPVAELAGVPVFRMDWSEKQLPLVTEKRAVYRELQKTAREHLLCYVTEEESDIAFVWAQEQEEQSRAEMRTLPFEQDSGARTTVEQLGELKFSIEELGLLEDPGVAAVLDRLDSAFDVERVTDEFFETYKEIFTSAEEAITGIEGDEKRLFTQRIFNRLLFIRFLEKKEWLRFGDRDDYLQALWDDYQSRGEEDNFYDDRLRPLFFEGLSNEEGHVSSNDTEDELEEKIGQVPFLNGGLFEQSSSDLDDSITVPDGALKPIFERLFYRFNFTITESTPLDVEVAVDPEMLGKIFEELVTGRHESGSYYTPKPIVAFMGQEALVHYLQDVLSDEEEEAIEDFVYEREAGGLRNPEGVLTALRTITICDPACGSGAYLLGMLRELLDLRSALFTSRQLDDRTMYERKQEIIQQNLYGVDFDDFAVNIARLRLWLSLVVDDQRNPLDDQEADVALPNLDYKIEVGDSLTAPNPQGTFQLQDEAVRKLQDKKAQFMRTHSRDRKEELQEEIDGLKEEILNWMPQNGHEDGFNWAVEFAEVFLSSSDPVATWKGELPLQGSGGQQQILEKEKVPGGFDIVLANPPYLRQEVIKREFGDDYKDLLTERYPETYSKTADAYIAFYDRANQILRERGVGCFISSNKWLRAGYGEDLRQKLLDDQAFHLVADFGDLPVFTASAYPCIFLWQKKERSNNPTKWAEVDDLELCYDEGVRKHIDRIAHSLPSSHFTGDIPEKRLRLTDPRVAKAQDEMNRNGVSLGSLLEGDINYGVKTGMNDAFIISEQKRRNLIEKDEKSKEIIKPVLTGADVRQYEIHFRNKYILFTRRGIEIEKYPAILEWLKEFKKDLMPTSSNKRGRKPGSYEWYEIQDAVDYYEDFEKEKIIYPVIGKGLRFTLDTKGYYGNDKTFILPQNSWYLLGVLNSYPVEFWADRNLSKLRGGYFEYRGANMKTLPIPEASGQKRAEVGSLAERAQNLHTERRGCVEDFMEGIGYPPSESTNRNSLEEPWKLDLSTFKKRGRKYGDNPDPQLFKAAKEITMELTTEINEVEQEIDEKVAGLYGIDLDDISE